MRKVLLTLDRRTLLPYLLLALSLLLAQAAAQAHVYSHLGGGGPRSDFNGAAGQLCSECLSAAPLLSPAGSRHTPRIAVGADGCGTIAFHAAPCARPASLNAFRSRAPPTLL